MKTLLLIFSLLSSPLFAALAENNIASIAKSNPLEEAYKREFIFLNAQKSQLELSLKKNSAHYRKLLKNLETEQNSKEASLVKLTGQNEKLDAEVNELEVQVSAINDSRSIFESTMEQAQSMLELKLSEELTPSQKSEQIFAAAQDKMRLSHSIEMYNSSFYDQSGKKVEGKIIKLGEIARYGVTSQTSGVLSPLGNKEWGLKSEGGDSALSLAEGKVPAVLNLYLYEDANRAIIEKESKNIVQFITSGGSVAWVIVVLGLVALVLVSYRAFSLKQLNNKHIPHRALTESDLLKIENHTHSSGAQFVQLIKNKLQSQEVPTEKMIEEAYLVVGSKLDKFGSMILVLASVAPLLGLLGTVTGMISTFDIITQFGTGDPKLLSSGISEALITTELGLVVAIPTLFFGNMLTSQSRKIKNQLEQISYLLLQSSGLQSEKRELNV
ncbi:MAG: hypothetical protein COW00_20110 [Bdellovibrio sp. CG12_big_fil_rev_8_21_14_0_65_39_13]|nr:MAG: hypothetical protein COW78_01795 [Bdellovibrio sp. CG22_combo_CG10-13_8_21_14_all_39_27]PIQ57534.1 MAG: hypothetical protein COW00_20110 [Bdellovibrio sp. CG12_big_fil_rev_8_21_14_0_65_39_13]PIR33737.1 MAG: hypothetical protein COV37_15200 [Bdellovibrio sp. CG11_big_fil_rev_8_21_14_0_20_39_38]